MTYISDRYTIIYKEGQLLPICIWCCGNNDSHNTKQKNPF